MLKEVTSEILELFSDPRFIRNLSVASIAAIACLFGLSDLQNQNVTISEQTAITNVSYSATRFLLKR